MFDDTKANFDDLKRKVAEDRNAHTWDAFTDPEIAGEIVELESCSGSLLLRNEDGDIIKVEPHPFIKRGLKDREANVGDYVMIAREDVYKSPDGRNLPVFKIYVLPA